MQESLSIILYANCSAVKGVGFGTIVPKAKYFSFSSLLNILTEFFLSFDNYIGYILLRVLHKYDWFINILYDDEYLSHKKSMNAIIKKSIIE